MLSEAALGAKVEDYLRKSNALQELWESPITPEQLEAEVRRITAEAKDPEELQELLKGLKEDPFLIAETLGRQVLADRLIRSLYDHDERFQRAVREEAEGEVRRLSTVEGMRSLGGQYREETWEFEVASPLLSFLQPGTTVIHLDGEQKETFIRVLAARFDVGLESPPEGQSPGAGAAPTSEEILARLPLRRPSGLYEGNDAFAVSAILETGPDRVKIATTSWPKVSFDSWWAHEAGSISSVLQPSPESSEPPAEGVSQGVLTDTWSAALPPRPNARAAHSAVWTGSELIIWGGYSADAQPLNTGFRYNPAADRWVEMTTVGAPAARGLHTALWTGSEMLVWGGNGAGGILNTGGRYNPSTDTWLPIASAGAPSERRIHAAVWTGSEMIDWGGEGQSEWLKSGGRYNPATDHWTPTTETGAPAGSRNHTAVWTGSEMIVWGGGGGVYGSLSPLRSGGRYNPATDSWRSMNEAGAPSARWEHTAVWTGSRMLVWGGSGVEPYSNSGGRYDPTTDTWLGMSRGANVPAIRSVHTALWTGNVMIVWGGSAYGDLFATGGLYNPATDAWAPTASLHAPEGRQYHAAIWTGTEMILWGGGFFTQGSFDSGGRYDPATDRWTPTGTGITPYMNGN